MAAAEALTALRRDAAAAEGLGQALELVGGLVDRLQMALVLVAAAGRGDVWMPALGHPPAGQLHRSLVERWLELEQEQSGFNIQDARP